MMRFFWASVLLLLVLSSCGTRRGTVLSNPNSSTNKTSTSRPAPSHSSLTYIEQYKDIAVREMNQYGIPASIKLAQAILESGNGNSYLAREANNHFGIKCGGNWNGKSVRRADDSPNDCFRVYRNPEESFRDHSEFLLRKRYERLFSLRKDDYKGWARGLKEAGYATNPRYAELLIDLIERYELYKYDRGETYAQQEVRETKVEEIIEEKEEKQAVVPPTEIKDPVKMVIYEVKPSDTLYAISRQYNVTVDQIRQLNDLTGDNLSIGQLLVIKK